MVCSKNRYPKISKMSWITQNWDEEKIKRSPMNTSKSNNIFICCVIRNGKLEIWKEQQNKSSEHNNLFTILKQ